MLAILSNSFLVVKETREVEIKASWGGIRVKT